MADDLEGAAVSVPTLIMTGGALDGTTYPLVLTGREIVVGSSMDADVQIALGNVEALHATISFESGSLLISDVGSATGTFVNGERIESSQALQEGDRICLGPPGSKGSAKLILRLPAGAAAVEVEEAPLFAEAPRPTLDGEGNLILGGDEDGAPPALAAETGILGAGLEETGLAPAEELKPDAAPLPEPDDAAFPASFPQEVGAGMASSDEPAATPAFLPPPAVETDDEFPPLSPLPKAPRPAPPQPAPSAASPASPAARPVSPPPPPPAPIESLSLKPSAPPPPPAAPEYESELPSILVTRPSPAARRSEPLPTLRPAARAGARPTRQAARRRRPISLPSAPLAPLLGAAAVVGLAALVWLIVWPAVFRKSAPELESVHPLRAEAGQTLTLGGRHFASEPAANTVTIGGRPAQVARASETELQVVIPAQVSAEADVIVQTTGGRSSALKLTVLPGATVTAVDPDVALPGQTVFIRGDGFAGQKLAVQFAGLQSPSVEVVPGGLRAVVPAVGLPEGSTTNVVVQAGDRAARSFPFILGHLPLVVELAPPRGAIGQKVVLNGRGFEPEPRANAVTFGGQRALVLSASTTSLAVIAPPPAQGEMQPDLPVVVTTRGRASSPSVFVYQRATTAGFVPRFFAAPVPEYPDESLAFVSTELGPLLLLGGPAGGASTAERAAQVADALNAAVDAARLQPARFELRDHPQPAVALAGSPNPLVVATAADAAAYGKPWDGSRAGRRVTPAALARYWTALLQDYLGLFLRLERPLQMLALSAHGKVLSEIYAETRRRVPGATNVPVSVVLPTPEGLATALRQMALVVSTEQGRSSAAIEGRWRGSIEDPDRGSARFNLQLRGDGGRLAGTLTTYRGALELTSQLREVSFTQGRLSFTADLQGAANRFQGTLEGNVVSGTIERAGKPEARFTLEYLE